MFGASPFGAQPFAAVPQAGAALKPIEGTLAATATVAASLPAPGIVASISATAAANGGLLAPKLYGTLAGAAAITGSLNEGGGVDLSLRGDLLGSASIIGDLTESSAPQRDRADGFTREELDRYRKALRRAERAQDRSRKERDRAQEELRNALEEIYSGVARLPDEEQSEIAGIVAPFAAASDAVSIAPPAVAIDFDALARSLEAAQALIAEIAAIEEDEDDIEMLLVSL
jgi:hypothetical protein